MFSPEYYSDPMQSRTTAFHMRRGHEAEPCCLLCSPLITTPASWQRPEAQGSPGNPASRWGGRSLSMSDSPVNGQLRNRRERLSHQVDNSNHFWHTEKRSQ